MAEPKKIILVVDDSREAFELFKAEFHSLNAEFIFAPDGAQGFESVLKTSPSCILLDIRMPREDGLSFLRKLRHYRDDDLDKEDRIRKTPVIVVTGLGDQMKPLFDLEGITDFVTKPYDVQAFKDRLVSVLQA